MVHGQNIDEYDKAILDVFPPPPSTETTETQNNNNECICLPYYKCNNQSIITDGTGLIDIRFVSFHNNNYNNNNIFNIFDSM